MDGRSTYLLFTVQAYEVMAPTGDLLNVCTLKLVCETEEEAIEKAKKLIQKPHYRIAEIIEFFTKEKEFI